MNSNNFSAIVIPVYKSFSELNGIELLSLKSTCEHLSIFSHTLVGPQKLEWSEYHNFFRSQGIDVEIKMFDVRYFINIEGYNKLLKSVSFYESFKNYRYILIHQTDAFILKDEFAFWCDKEYDYIGAPWFEEYENNEWGKTIIGAGNGGFSLRNVKSTIKILKRVKVLLRIRSFWFTSCLQSIVRFENFISIFKSHFRLRNNANFEDILLAQNTNEDHYFAQVLPNIFTDYKVAPIEDSIRFSFEVNPSLLYEMNNHKLPFGCHAWEKNDPGFWKEFIKINA